MRLNLGCGNRRLAGFVGVDRYVCDGADVLADLSKTLPFRDSSADEILLDNVIEHIADIPELMAELVRVGRHGARIVMLTPHFTALSSWKDPTHIHHLSYFSFDHFEKSSTRHYMGGGITVASRRLSFGGGVSGLLGRLIYSISPLTYEKTWCFIFRASTLRFELVVDKPSAEKVAP